jgi:hypothetical protein
MPSEPVAVTLLVVEALERLGVPYLIGGSLGDYVQSGRLYPQAATF